MNVMSLQNELRVLQSINKMCTEGLNKYPTTLRTDMEILYADDVNSELTFNQRNCVLFRVGEKEILQFYIEFADFMIPLLSMKWKDAKKVT